MITPVYTIEFHTDQSVDDHEVWIEKVKALAEITEFICLTYFIHDPETRATTNIFKIYILLGDKGYEDSCFSLTSDIIENSNISILFTSKTNLLSGEYIKFESDLEALDKIDKVLSCKEYSNGVHNSEIRNALYEFFNQKPNFIFFNLLDLLNWMGNKYIFPPQSNIELYTIKEKILLEEEKVRKRDEDMERMEGGNT